jgi:hypothetical protein
MMTNNIRRLQPGDELLALQVVRDLMPEEEREGREPTIGQFTALTMCPLLMGKISNTYKNFHFNLVDKLRSLNKKGRQSLQTAGLFNHSSTATQV